ncbi:MAG: hypothetical protein ACE5NN_05420 [Candidatus Bathyarchaeia archaeon]
MTSKKIEIMYFYSDLYESERKLSRLCKSLSKERKDIKIKLVNVEDPENEDVTRLYSVNMVPVMIFLTPKGEVAARRCMPLSVREVIEEVTERISNGELPNPVAERVRQKILDAFRSVTKRNDLTQLIVDEVMNDLQEADSELELYEMINSHISAINHTIHDLENFKQVLQKFSKRQPHFIV